MKLMYDSIYKTFRMNEIITLMYDTFSDTYVGLQIWNLCMTSLIELMYDIWLHLLNLCMTPFIELMF